MKKIKFGHSASFLAGALIFAMVGCQANELELAGTRRPVVTPLPSASNGTTTVVVVSPAPGTNASANPGNVAVVPTTAPGTVMATGQIDRLAIPSLALVFVGFNGFTRQLGVTKEAGDAGLDNFNTQSPGTDVGNYRGAISSALQTLFKRTPADANGIASVLTPDVINIDTTKTTMFPNGRALKDDVIDIELKLLSGVPAATDKIDRNDRGFMVTFPYIEKPF